MLNEKEILRCRAYAKAVDFANSVEWENESEKDNFLNYIIPDDSPDPWCDIPNDYGFPFTDDKKLYARFKAKYEYWNGSVRRAEESRRKEEEKKAKRLAREAAKSEEQKAYERARRNYKARAREVERLRKELEEAERKKNYWAKEMEKGY